MNDDIMLLRKLLECKKNNLISSNNMTELEKRKIESLENLFNNSQCFLNLKFDVAINILNFLGVKQNEILPLYRKLISPKIMYDEDLVIKIKGDTNE